MGVKLFGVFTYIPYKLVKVVIKKIYGQFSSYSIKKPSIKFKRHLKRKTKRYRIISKLKVVIKVEEERYRCNNSKYSMTSGSVIKNS